MFVSEIDQLIEIGHTLVYLATLSCVASAFLKPLNGFIYYGKVEQELEKKQFADWLYVPKWWFIFYYVVSATACLTSWYFDAPNKLILSLLTVQSVRRLIECLGALKNASSVNSSRMLVFHFIAGLVFYLTLQAAAWDPKAKPVSFDDDSAQYIAGIALFSGCSIMQSNIHRYLGSLKKYSLPTAPLFRIAACPHYLAEVGIYSSLLILDIDSRTLKICIFWVIASLSISAMETKKYYVKKYGQENVSRFAIFPGFY